MTRKKQPEPATVQTNPANDADNISLDMGNAYTNVQSDGAIALDYRSIMAPLSTSNRLGDLPVENVINYEGQLWAVGDACYTLAPNAIQENPTVNRYTSAWYKRLFAFALHKTLYKRAGQEIFYPRIISSVPAELFRNQDETAAIAANLCGHYEIGNTFGGQIIVDVLPRRLVLIPEGVGTYFGLVFGGGNNAQYKTGTWMIADSGYLTLDTVMLRDGEYIADASRSDERTGLSSVADKLRDFVFTRSRTRLDRASIDNAMQCATITVNTNVINVEQARTDALIELGKRASLLLEQWSAGHNLSGIIFTGGGAEYLFQHITSSMLPPLTLAARPRRANVEGAYTYIVSD